MTFFHPELVNFSGRHVTSWIGYGFADGSGTAIPITIPSNTSPQAARAELVTFRITGTISTAYPPLHVMGTSFSPTTPGGDKGITALVSAASLTTTQYGDETSGAWASTGLSAENGHDNYAATFVAYCTTGAPTGTWAGVGSSAIVAALTIGLTEA